MRAGSICRKCSRDHCHVRIQASLTKKSAVYCPGLVEALGALFQKRILAEKALQKKVGLKTERLEPPLVNDVAKTAAWRVSSSWKWKGKSHINILELSGILQALKLQEEEEAGHLCLSTAKLPCELLPIKGHRQER